MININFILLKKMITNYFQILDNNYKDIHSDPKWKKINFNESKDLEDIKIKLR